MAFFTDTFLKARREELLRAVSRFQYQLNGSTLFLVQQRRRRAASASGRQLEQWRLRWPVQLEPLLSAQLFQLGHRGPFRFCGAAR